MTLALVVAHDATLPKPAPVPTPGGAPWPHSALPDGLTIEDEADREAIAAGRTESTRKTYALAWRRSERWCAARAITPLPAAPATVCAYMADFATHGVASGTIEGACAAIAAEHNREGQPNPCVARSQ